jgi:hypothetical protein
VKWQFLFVLVWGDNAMLSTAQNMLVMSSDGRWREEKMPNDVYALFTQLGQEGWELIGHNSGVSAPFVYPTWPQSYEQISASFKRQVT